MCLAQARLRAASFSVRKCMEVGGLTAFLNACEIEAGVEWAIHHQGASWYHHVRWPKGKTIRRLNAHLREGGFVVSALRYQGLDADWSSV